MKIDDFKTYKQWDIPLNFLWDTYSSRGFDPQKCAQKKPLGPRVLVGQPQGLESNRTQGIIIVMTRAIIFTSPKLM